MKLPLPDIATLPIEGLLLGPQKFTVPTHDQIVSQLNSSSKAKECTNLFIRAQWIQDTYHQSDSKAHFDNCDFSDALEYIRQLTAEADEDADRSRWSETLFSYGQALHAIADFYAHSNFVERAVATNESWPVHYLPVWLDDGRATVLDEARHGLISGRWLLGGPKDCAADGPTHAQLNKDSPESPRGKDVISAAGWEGRSYHQAAKEIAISATRAYLERAFARSSGFSAHCDGALGFLLTLDHRHDGQQ